ncbi:hypothetical protein [Catellatospora sp. NPDC049609]|uniref:hypothetical protein n=1 Tax=Catellatospora sp. NPDC049609 TaxID=3155505 RepID=UPI003448B460
MPPLICSICLYVLPRPDLGEDATAETEMVTVINGQATCVRHAGIVAGGEHSIMLLAAVRMESRGEFTQLGPYQDWRGRQQDAAEADTDGHPQ